MSDNVVPFPGSTVADIPAGTIVKMAAEVDFKSMIIFGLDENGNEHLLSTTSDAHTVIYLLERARHQMHGVIDGHMAGNNNGKP